MPLSAKCSLTLVSNHAHCNNKIVTNLVNPLQVVLERLSCVDPAKGALFFWDEVKNWPPSTLDLMVTNGLLQQAQPMTTIECDGCEKNCIMPVTIYPAQDDKPGRAFILCDKHDDIGRVLVDFRRMQQWLSTSRLVAAMLTSLLGFSQSPTKTTDGKQWHIGTLMGRKNRYPVMLLTDDGLTLLLAGHTVSLIDVLSITENTLALNKAALMRLVNNPTNDNETESPEARRERLIARIREEKTKGTKAFLRLVADEEGISVTRLKQIRDNDTQLKENIPKNNSLADLLFNSRQASSKKSKTKN